MPRMTVGVKTILQACDGIIEAARNETEQLLGGRAAFVGTHVAARTGLQVQMRRGRSVANRVDAVVRASFDGDEVTLAAWRAAKRMHQLPGGSGVRGPVEEEAVALIAQAA